MLLKFNAQFVIATLAFFQFELSMAIHIWAAKIVIYLIFLTSVICEGCKISPRSLARWPERKMKSVNFSIEDF